MYVYDVSWKALLLLIPCAFVTFVLSFLIGHFLAEPLRLLVTDEAGNVLAKRAKNAVAPGEMESMELSAEALRGLRARGAKEIRLFLEETAKQEDRK